MAELTLQEYCQEIEGLIERSAYDEAVAHCHHILEQYPKYVEAYRLIGKASLDREDDQQASEMFARVLSADPADFVSRAGLSIIYDRQEKLKEAMWQMERAYELEPGNPVVQDELRKLYARRDGVTPERIPLTRGSLARLYLNGELNSEAVAELRALLAQEPDRVDLQILLAEALWRDEQRLESADVALKVLDRLPYCLDANLILGEIWMNGGREEDAEVHLKRATSLDPEAIRAWALLGKSSPIPVKSVEVMRLNYVSPTTVVPVAEQAPEWLSGLGLQPEAGEAEGVPSWLEGVGAPAPEAEQPVAEEPGIKLPVREPPQEAPEEEIPAWLTGLGVLAEPAAEERPAPSLEGEAVPDWLSQLRGAAPAEAEQPAAAQGEQVPDWLSQLHDKAGPMPGAAVEEGAATPEAGEVPDWLQALRPEGAEQPAEAAEGVPEWLSGVSAPMPPPVEEEAEAAPEAGEVPDWMQALRPEGAEQPAEAAEGVAEWLSGVSAPMPPPVEEEAVSAPEAAEIPDWLQALRPEGAEQPAEVGGGVPEWLSSVGAPVPPAAEQEFVETPAPSEIPDWLQPLQQEGVELIAPVEAEAVVPVSETTVEPVAPESEPLPPWLTGGGAMPSPEEAMAYFAKLTAGKEVELQAQAQAEAESRMAEIMGRKPEPTPTPPPPPTPVTPPPAPVAAPQPPKVEAPPPPVEETPAWLAGEGAMPSPEEAMAYFAKLTAGKEAELQAQAQAEAELRMAEIMGRKPEPTPTRPPPPTPVTPPPAPVAAPQPPKVEAPPPLAMVGPAPKPPVEKVEPVVAPPTPAPEEAAPAPAEWIEAVAAEVMLPEVKAPGLAAVPTEAIQPAVELEPLEGLVSVAPPEVVPPITPAEAMPEATAQVPVAPRAAGPEWWYQTLADEEGPTEEELAAEALAEAAQAEEAAEAFAPPPVPEPAPAGRVGRKPTAPLPTLPPEPVPAGRVGRKPTGPLAPPPSEPAPAARVERKRTGPLAPSPSAEPAPAPGLVAREPKRLVRAKPAPAVPPKPAVDIDALMERLRANPDDRSVLLDLARGWVQLDDMTAARGAYDELIRAGASLDQVIFDLEEVLETHPDDVDTIRLMGDAHMKSGNLKNALKLYRQALKKL
jgi:tetratricopeptide (TPR) repeat protein